MNSNPSHILRVQEMIADLEARKAAGLARNPRMGSGTREAFDNAIAAARRLLARISST